MSDDMSDETTTNLLDRFKPQTSYVSAVSDAVDDIAEEIKGYQAWGSDKTNPKPKAVMVLETGEVVSAISYPFLSYPYTTNHKMIGIILTFGRVTLKGKHLTELIGLLAEQKIAWIRKWDANLWPIPDEGIPVITEVEWQLYGEESIP